MEARDAGRPKQKKLRSAVSIVKYALQLVSPRSPTRDLGSGVSFDDAGATSKAAARQRLARMSELGRAVELTFTGDHGLTVRLTHSGLGVRYVQVATAGGEASSLVASSDELVAVNGKALVNPNLAKFQRVLARLASPKRPLVLTFFTHAQRPGASAVVPRPKISASTNFAVDPLEDAIREAETAASVKRRNSRYDSWQAVSPKASRCIDEMVRSDVLGC